MSGCSLLFVFIYSSAAVFTMVTGQSTTDDVIDINEDLRGVIEQQASTIATLQAEVEKLKARQSSVTVDNRKSFSINSLYDLSSSLTGTCGALIYVSHLTSRMFTLRCYAYSVCSCGSLSKPGTI